MQQSLFASTILKVTALLVFLCGLASQKHAVTSIGDRATFATAIVSCFNRITEKDIDSGAEELFDLSQNEWRTFRVFQEADDSCLCTAKCANVNARIDMYITFERRPRLDDNWDGWACKATLASNEQTCRDTVPKIDSICRVAIRGDSFDRPHSKCTVICTVDGSVG